MILKEYVIISRSLTHVTRIKGNIDTTIIIIPGSR